MSTASPRIRTEEEDEGGGGGRWFLPETIKESGREEKKTKKIWSSFRCVEDTKKLWEFVD